MKKNILVIEDEVTHSDFMKYALEKIGYEVTVAADIKKAKKILLKQGFFVVFLDLTLTDGEGFRILEFITLKRIDTAVIILSASKDL